MKISCNAATSRPISNRDSPLSSHGEKKCSSSDRLCIFQSMSFAQNQPNKIFGTHSTRCILARATYHMMNLIIYDTVINTYKVWIMWLCHTFFALGHWNHKLFVHSALVYFKHLCNAAVLQGCCSHLSPARFTLLIWRCLGIHPNFGPKHPQDASTRSMVFPVRLLD
jgi:hypothetical protein